MHVQGHKWQRWMLPLLLVIISLLLNGGQAMAAMEANAKIWRSPVWSEDTIVRDYLLVKFGAPAKAKAFMHSLGLEASRATKLPEGWSGVPVRSAAKAMGVTMEEENGKPSLQSVKAVARELAHRPDVEMVAFDYAVFHIPPKEILKPTLLENSGITPKATPTDPLYGVQWHFTPTSPKHGANAEGAWDITHGDPSTRVAVIDTGVTEGPDGFAHPFAFECNTADPVGPGVNCGPGSQSDGDGHGTHVAGTIAQETAFPPATDDGVAGIAPDISLIAIQTFATGSGEATGTDIAEAITLAAQNGAKVINMSLGADCGTLTWDQGCNIPVVDDAIEDAVNNHDVLIVAAAGNASETVVGTPANNPLVMAIAATDQNSLAYYSTHGAGLSMSAPGGNWMEDVDGDGIRDLIFQETRPHGGTWAYYGFQGTSMASPHVAGAAGLLRSHNPAATWKQVRYCLESTAVDQTFGDPAGYDPLYGWGLLDIEAALNCIASPPALPTQPDAFSSTADLGGLTVSTPQNAPEKAAVHLSETVGVDLNWNVFFSENSDCSSNDTIPWLDLDAAQPASGTLVGYGSTSINLDLDPSTVPVGTYTAYVCLGSNDPDAGPGNHTDLIPVQIRFTVEEALPAPDELMCNAARVTFENGIPGTWKVVDNEGTDIAWDVTGAGTCEQLGNYTNGAGKAACVDSDAIPGEFDTELRTNAITIPNTATSATLTFTANYQNYWGLDHLHVDVSTDDGASWTNILSWNEDHGAFYNTPGEDVSLDLSAYIGQTILIRWHYYDPNTDDWDWYAEIDDVKLECPGAPSHYPNINVDPLSLSSEQDGNLTTTQTLSIANTGESDLAWSTGEEDQGFTSLGDGPLPPKTAATPTTTSESGIAIHANGTIKYIKPAIAPSTIKPQGKLDYTIAPPHATTTPTIDGQINAAEWADAMILDIGTGPVPVLMYLKYDPATNMLYLAIDDQWDPTAITDDQVAIIFDDEGGTPPALFDNAWTNSACSGTVQGEGYTWMPYGAAPSVFFAEKLSDNTLCSLQAHTNITFASSDAAGNMQYEASIPLDGSAALQAQTDQFFGFAVFVYDDDFGSLDGLWPAYWNSADPATFGNIHLATTCTSLGDVDWLSLAPSGDSVKAGESEAVTVTFDSTGKAPGTYKTNVCIYSNDPDLPTGDNGTGLVVVPITMEVRGVDLEVSQTVDNPTPLLGQNVTFTVTVSEKRNAYDATGLQITDLLPAGLSHVSNTASQGTYDPATGVWDVGTLPKGTSATLTITAQTTTVGAITNAAEVTAVDQADLDSTPGDGTGDDYAETTLNVAEAIDLAMDATASNTAPSPDEEFTVTFTVHNDTPAVTASGVQVKAFFGNSFEYVSHTASQGAVTVTMGSTHIDWNVGSLAAGDAATLTVTLRALERPKDWRNWAEVVAADQTDRDSTPNDRQGDDYATLDIELSLPPTGFPAGRESTLPSKPDNLVFATTDMVLEIPRLGISDPIVGVPSTAWESIAWLGEEIGYLEHTTFPTWRGNSVLTAHNYLPSGAPGPFVNLSQLRWGDVVRIKFMGQIYEYEVRRVTVAHSKAMWPFKYNGSGTWITLLTCKGPYDEYRQAYPYRVVVQAVLMRVYPAP